MTMMIPSGYGTYESMCASMNKPLTYRDIPLLHSAGFRGEGLWSWFGKDRHEQTWQVQEAEDNSLLQFRQVGHKSTGEWVHLALPSLIFLR